MGNLRTRVRNGRYNVAPPEIYIHPELGACTLLIPEKEGSTWAIKWKTDGGKITELARKIPIVTNPILEFGTEVKGSFYAIPNDWNGLYFDFYFNADGGLEDIFPNYTTIAEWAKTQFIEVDEDDNIVGSGGGTTTNTVLVPFFGEVPQKTFYIAIALGVLLLLIINKK